MIAAKVLAHPEKVQHAMHAFLKVGWHNRDRQPYFECMKLFFALAILSLPILDIVSLIKAGALLGFWPTLALLGAAAVLGTTVIRQQRFAAAARMRQSLAAGELPVREAFDSACVLLAGLLLLFPGFISDIAAALLLLPPVRLALRRMLARSLAAAGATVIWSDASGIRPEGMILDGEFEPVGSAAQPPPAPSDGSQPEPVRSLPAPVIVDRSDP
jgi:UPF0716 protein FxsA